MNEAALVKRIVEYVKGNLAGPVVVLKHHDRVTAGIADLSVCYRARTSWLEVKYLERPELRGAARKAFDPRQLASLFRLAQTGVPVRYVIGYPLGEDNRLRI